MAWHSSAWHGSAYAGDLEVAVEDLPRRRYARKSASGIAVAAGGLGREGSKGASSRTAVHAIWHAAAQPPASRPGIWAGGSHSFVGNLDLQRLCADARPGALAVAAVAAAEPTITMAGQQVRNLPRAAGSSPWHQEKRKPTRVCVAT